MMTSGFVFTGCSLILPQGTDTEVYRNFTMAMDAGTEVYRNLTMATRYTMASRQRRTLPTGGGWTRLYRRDITSLSFFKPGADQMESLADAVSLDREHQRSAYWWLWHYAFCPLSNT